MNFKRSERVSELLRHEISQMVQAISDPKLGFVTITGVRLSDDLTDAKVFYSVLGSPEDRENSARILTGSVPSIRHDLGRKLESLRRVPMIAFIYDETPERAQRVTEILKELAHEKEDEGPTLTGEEAYRQRKSRKKEK